MIDVKKILKPKSGGIGTGASGTGLVVKTADEAKHAVKADNATHAELAEYANRSGYASRAAYADKANELAEGSPIYDKFLRKDINDTAAGLITFLQGLTLGEDKGSIDAEGNASLKGVTVSDKVTSPDFVNGMTGSGYRLWQEDGLSYLELDKLTVRQTMSVYELLINKIRSVGGQIVVSAANGKIKTVQRQSVYYIITFEETAGFQLGDLLRCQTFNGDTIKSYWVEVIGTYSSGAVQVKTSEFSDCAPEVGDEVVLMGSTENKKRQNLVLISATDDGQPRVDVLNGVSSKSFYNSLRARLGNLDGIESSAFPATLQPQGDGLFADNAYLKGTFILSTGEDVKTRFEITDQGIKSQVESLRDDFQTEDNHLLNSSFTDGLGGWSVTSKAQVFSTNSKFIWANDCMLVKNGASTVLETIDGRAVAHIKNCHLAQRNAYMVNLPDTSADNTAVGVTLTFRYKCISGGTLTARLVSTEVDVLNVKDTLTATDGWETYTATGVWYGTESLLISFTGEMYIAVIALRTDSAQSIAYKYQTLFEQSDKLVQIAAQNFDKDGNVIESSSIVTTAKANKLISEKFNTDGSLKNTTGLVTTSEFATMFASEVTSEGIVKQADISAFVSKDADGNLESGVTVKADNIKLEGLVTANDKFKVNTDGSIEATDGVFNGDVSLKTLTYENFLVGGMSYVMEELTAGVLKEVAYFCPLVTRAGVTISLSGASSKVMFLETMTTLVDKATTTMTVTGIGKLVGYNIDGTTYWINCPYGT